MTMDRMNQKTYRPRTCGSCGKLFTLSGLCQHFCAPCRATHGYSALSLVMSRRAADVKVV